MRLRAVRQNCGSNFSRLARQRKLPAVATRLFFLFNGNLVVVGKLGSDPKGKIAKAILASFRATVLRRGSCQTFFYLTGICSGGKVRMRAVRQNCG